LRHSARPSCSKLMRCRHFALLGVNKLQNMAVIIRLLEATPVILQKCDIYLVNSAKEHMRSSLFVCSLATLRENFRTDLHKSFRKCWQWASEQMIKLWWRPSRYRNCFRVRHYWEIRKVVINGHKPAAHTESPDGGTGKTRLCGGMQCPIASNILNCFSLDSLH